MTDPSSQAVTSPSHRHAPFFAPLQREFDRMMSEFDGFDLGESFGPSPRIDMRTGEGAIELTAELPGMTEDDIRIELQDDVLTLSGEKKASSERRGKDYRMVERRYGAFSRSVRLPAEVKADQIAASLKHGVLTITAPLSPEAAERTVTIPVKRG